MIAIFHLIKNHPRLWLLLLGSLPLTYQLYWTAFTPKQDAAFNPFKSQFVARFSIILGWMLMSIPYGYILFWQDNRFFEGPVDAIYGALLLVCVFTSLASLVPALIQWLAVTLLRND